jgi:hypothetical protein
MLDSRSIGNQVRFSGYTNVDLFADQQTGPTCGFEAVENVIQLFHPQHNALTQQDLLPRAQHYGYARDSDEGLWLDPRGYQHLLADYGIAARWYPFDYRQVVIPALRSNRGVLVVGDAHRLNPGLYPSPDSGHAFVLTNYFTEESGVYILGYVGIDSNVPGRETPWGYECVEAAAAWAAGHVMRCPVLVTDQPGNWRMTAQFYRLLPGGQLVPVA